MRPVLFAFVSLVPLALAQSTNPPCVATCVKNNLRSSQCDGDETGAAKDKCDCGSFAPTGDPLIECVKGCSPEDQAVYAGRLPELCRGTLLPGVEAVESSTTSSTSTSTSSSSGSAGPSKTSSGSGESATATGSGASPSGSAAGGGAGSVGVSGLAAFVAVVAGLV